MHVLIIILGLFAIGYGAVRWTATDMLRDVIGPMFVVNYVGSLLIGFLAPNAVIYFVLLLALFVGTCRSRVDAACRFVLLVTLLPNVESYLTIGGAALIVLRGVDVLAIGLLIVSLTKRDAGVHSGARGIGAEDMTVLLLLLIFWAGAIRFPSLTVSLRSLIEQGFLVALPFVALLAGVRSATELRRIVACLAAASAILALFAIYEARESWAMFDPILQRLNSNATNRSMNYRGGTMRASATMSGPLPLALHLALGFVAALYSRNAVRSGNFHLGWLAVILLGQLSAQSRGSLICVVLALLIFFIVRGRWLYAALIGLAAPAGLALMLAAARWSSSLASFLNVGEARGEGVYDYRQLLLQRGMEEAAKHRWLGTAMNDVTSRLLDIVQGEHIIDFVNTYLVIYIVSGLIGFTALMFALLLVLRNLMRRVPLLMGQAAVDMRAFMLTAFIVVLVQLAFMSFIDRVPLYLMLALAGSKIIDGERRWFRLRAPPPEPVMLDADWDEGERAPPGPLPA